MTTSQLEVALGQVRGRIAEAAERAGREPRSVRIVAVTKGRPISAARAALSLGLSDLGENRVEELEVKVPQIESADVRWHMIGRLQRRKAPEVRALAHSLHSLDSVKLAERLERTAPDGTAPMPVLVQVNTAGEEQKTGFEPGDFFQGMEAILAMESLRVEGLMTMAPFTQDENVLRAAFRRLRELNDEARSRFPGYSGVELSMGMSNDYQVAVEEGSTMVRLGTVLFGERDG